MSRLSATFLVQQQAYALLQGQLEATQEECATLRLQLRASQELQLRASQGKRSRSAGATVASPSAESGSEGSTCAMEDAPAPRRSPPGRKSPPNV